MNADALIRPPDLESRGESETGNRRLRTRVIGRWCRPAVSSEDASGPENSATTAQFLPRWAAANFHVGRFVSPRSRISRPGRTANFKTRHRLGVSESLDAPLFDQDVHLRLKRTDPLQVNVEHPAHFDQEILDTVQARGNWLHH